METLVQDYLLDEDDNIASVAMQGQGGDAGMSSAQMEPDLADGDDIVFYNKYGDQGFDENDDELEDDEFDNGYYF